MVRVGLRVMSGVGVGRAISVKSLFENLGPVLGSLISDISHSYTGSLPLQHIGMRGSLRRSAKTSEIRLPAI